MQQVERTVILWVAVAMALLLVFSFPYAFSSIRTAGPYSGAQFLASAMVGAVVAFVGLLAVWCVLANQATFVRVPLGIGLFVIATGLVLFAYRLLEELHSIEEAAQLGFFGVILFFGMQAPLWVVRILLRRRIGLRNDNHDHVGDRKVSIRYLLTTTTVVAVILALFRVALPSSDFGNDYLMPVSILIGLALFVVFSVSMCLPCLWLMLSERPASHSTAAIVLFLNWVGGPIALLMTATALLQVPIDPAGFLPPFYAFGLAACGCMLAGLQLFRMLGYRLMIVAPEGNLVVEADLRQSSGNHTSAAATEHLKEPPSPGASV